MSFISKLFGINVKKWRSIRGLSQEDVAASLNFHSNTVGRFERGEHFCKPETIEKLAKLLKISPSELFVTNSKEFNVNDTDIIYKIGKELGSLSKEDLEKTYRFILSVKS